MKIAVSFTGGTIGSKMKDGRISTDPRSSYELLSAAPVGIDFVTSEPMDILSEYMTGEDIMLLKSHVSDLLKGDYSGIIITHGSDTLQYTAAALGYFFADCKIPIILVAAQKVLSDPGTNGFVNFSDAVEFIKNGLGRGVFVCYKNPDGRRLVHRGTRLMAGTAYTDALSSVCGSFYGEFTPSGFVKNTAFSVVENDASLYEGFINGSCEKVLCVESKTGLSAEVNSSIKAVLHSSYHSGTVNTRSKKLFMQAKKLNIPVFVTGSSKSVAYESAAQFKRLGIKTLPVMSPLAAYIKIWILTDSGLPLSRMRKSIGEDIITN